MPSPAQGLPEPTHRRCQTGESKWLWDLRGTVRSGIGEGTSPQATAEQGLQDTAGLDMWTEGGVPGREQPTRGWEVPVVTAWLLCANLCHLQAAPGWPGWQAGPGPAWERIVKPPPTSS